MLRPFSYGRHLVPDDKPATTLPAFTPVPREKDRSNGWKPHIQRAFIEALADTGSVAAACRAVGRSTHGAYNLRRQPGAEEFAAAWEAAIDMGMRRIEDTAMDRALNGVEVPVYSYGKLVGSRTVHNDRLLMFMLRNRAPERFAEGRGAMRQGGMNAIDKMELDRLKKQWRKEWEREWGAKQLERECTTIASINAKIDAMQEKADKLASPELLAARDAYDAAYRRDQDEDYSPWHDPRHEVYNPALTSRGARIPVSENADADEAKDAPFPLYDTQDEADAAGIVFNGALLPPPDAESSEEDEPDLPGTPRLRSIRDEGWD